MDMLAVQATLPKTGQGARGKEVVLQFNDDEVEDILAMTEYVSPGLPMLDKLLKEKVNIVKGPLIVACECLHSPFSILRNSDLPCSIGCSPTQLSMSIRKIIVAQIDPVKIKASDQAGYISCVTEEFEYQGGHSQTLFFDISPKVFNGMVTFFLGTIQSIQANYLLSAHI